MSTFLALLRLEDFVAECKHRHVHEVYYQQTVRVHYYGGIRSRIVSFVTVTACGWTAPVGAPILISRVPVEQAALNVSNPDEVGDAVERRAAEAADLIAAYLITHTEAELRPGMLLKVGMFDELEKIETAHAVWTWQNPKDVIERRLIPSETLAGDADPYLADARQLVREMREGYTASICGLAVTNKGAHFVINGDRMSREDAVAFIARCLRDLRPGSDLGVGGYGGQVGG